MCEVISVAALQFYRVIVIAGVVENPLIHRTAIMSSEIVPALVKLIQCDSLDRNSLADVALPVTFGAAMMMVRLSVIPLTEQRLLP